MTGLRLGIETGGTFTDWVLSRGDHIEATGKVMSTPAEPERAVLAAVTECGVPPAEIAALIHGSTVVTNAVLERKGARTCLVTTKGFRDVLLIQRQAKTRLFDLFYRQPEPLVSRDHIIEADERIGADGGVRRALEDFSFVDQVGRLVRDELIQSVAICFLHAYVNPAHEIAAEEALAAALPGVAVTRSSDVLPQFREYERTSTCVISAYAKPVVDGYLSRLEDRLRDRGFRGPLTIVQANGGTIPAGAIRRHAAKMILSGPAAGVVGATTAALEAGFPNMITFDMGGTSTDVCLVTDGRPGVTREYKIAGLPLNVPMIDIATVGAGGGSIADVDRGGILKVGPESAGADPGPAAYGKGGTAFTVTDANVLAGRIRPEAFFGGRLRLDAAAGEAALGALADRVGLPRRETLDGVLRLVNVTMAQAVRLVSIERGYDPRDYTIVAYGGSGPLHAAAVAADLGIARVLVPVNPGLVSAYGLLLADTRQDFSVTRVAPAARVADRDAAALFADLAAQARREFEAYDRPWREVTCRREMDMRYAGQAYEISVPCDGIPVAAAVDAFHEAHHVRYGHAVRDQSVEVVGYRLIALAPSPLRAIRPAPGHGGAPAPRAEDYHPRHELDTGDRLAGPCVVEEPTATTYVPQGWAARADRLGNLILEAGA
ncbi:MAG TPA: hydantoinase/oxoprolinase family protein [bacterium]|nr:hydantoinase/oxoprolinase family protein [bacterium]